jgi:hypothetical protein
MKEDTPAMNTARQSAAKTRLIPSGRDMLKATVSPAIARGIKLSEKIKDAATTANAIRFLRRPDIRPASGRKNEPANGRKTANSIGYRVFIKIKALPSLKGGPISALKSPPEL